MSFGNVNVYMPIVPVTINNTFHTHALLDTGSSNSFCSQNLVDRLRLTGTKTNYQLKTLTSCSSQETQMVSLNISSEDGRQDLHMKDVLVTGCIPIQNSPCDVTKYPHLKDLYFSNSSTVDLLIGQDHPAALVPIEVRRGCPKSPFATRTMLGWSLNGVSPPDSDASTTSRHVTTNLISIHPLEQNVNRLWDIKVEDPKAVEGSSPDDHRVLEQWDRTCKVVDDNFQLLIPWKTLQKTMPTDLHLAQSQSIDPCKTHKKKAPTPAYDAEIQSKDNAADLLTRDTSLEKLNQRKWTQGPIFLRTLKSDSYSVLNVPDSDQEVKKKTVSSLVTGDRKHPGSLTRPPHGVLTSPIVAVS